MVNTLTLSSTHTHNKPISIYVHLPWCIKRCLYCDFNAHQQPSALPNEEYYQQLMKDLDDITPIINNRPVTSIFFGGGTPNLCPPWLFSELLNTIAKRFTLNNSVEITMEANPGASHLDTLGAYQKAGINRLSIGVQSFNSQHLQLLGRIHNPKDALAMVEHAHTLGFNSINIDIMYGLPLQTPKESISDVEQALALPIDHLSWYHLTIEPNTYFAKHPPRRADEDTRFIMEENGLSLLKDHQWFRYEVSAYTKQKNHQSTHNLNYWHYGDFLGIGAGAHSKWQDNTNHFRRSQRIRSPKHYMSAQSTISQCYLLDAPNIVFEYMLNRLRIPDPVSFQSFTQQTQLSIEMILPTLQELESESLIKISEQGFHLTEQGWLFLDHCTERFLPS